MPILSLPTLDLIFRPKMQFLALCLCTFTVLNVLLRTDEIISDLRILIIDIRIFIIDIRIFLSRRRWLTIARNDDLILDDPLPSYTEACLSPSLSDAAPYTEACQPPIPHNTSPVQRLQSFIAWPLATEY